MKDADLERTCLERALEVLHASVHEAGFVASGSLPHYSSVWARDAAFTAFGATCSDDPELVEAVKRSLISLAERQSGLGQVPNAFWPERGYWDWGEAGATDATALFIIVTRGYVEATGDRALGRQLGSHLEKAFTWLTYQDANNFGLIDSPEAADWMDSSLNRSGKVLYNNVLFAAAANAMADLTPDSGAYRRRADSINEKINTLFWPDLHRDYGSLLSHVEYPTEADRSFPHAASVAAYREAAREDRRFYLSHVRFGSFVDLCDVLANILAILYGVADDDRARLILEHLTSNGVAEPYPIRTWPEPITDGNDRWGLRKQLVERFQEERWHNPPFRYHNAGVWPFIGGLYVVALAKHGFTNEAQRALSSLAAANRLGGEGEEWGFHEWIDGESGVPGGASAQAWNAGTYLLAYRTLEGREPIL